MLENKECLVTSGIPGCGKSTYLCKNAPSATVCSADQFFLDDHGLYVFDRNKLGAAHNYCWELFRMAVMTGDPVVAVDNTNLNWSEMGRYVELALQYGYKVRVVQFSVPTDVAAARNVHGVPAEHIGKMARKQLVVPSTITQNPNFSITKVLQ